MTLSEMRKALETTTGEDETTNPEQDGGTSNSTERPKARLPPESRGVKESRSLLVEVDLSEHASGGQQRKGTLTFANSVSELRRAGSSREVDGAGKPLRRAPPRRAQSCAQG